MIKKSYIFLLLNFFLLLSANAGDIDLVLIPPSSQLNLPPIEASATLNKARYRLTYKCGGMIEGGPKGKNTYIAGWNSRWTDGQGNVWGSAFYSIGENGSESEAPGSWLDKKPENEPDNPYLTEKEAETASIGSDTMFEIIEDSTLLKLKYKAITSYPNLDGTSSWGAGGVITYTISRVIVNITGYRLDGSAVEEKDEMKPAELKAFVVNCPKDKEPPVEKFVRVVVDKPDPPEEDKDEDGNILPSVTMSVNVSGSKHQLWIQKDGKYVKTSDAALGPKAKEEGVTFFVQPLEVGVISAKVTYHGSLSQEDTVRMQVELCPCVTCKAGETKTVRSGGGFTMTFTWEQLYNGEVSFGGWARTTITVRKSNLKYTVKPDENNEVTKDSNGDLQQVKTKTTVVNVQTVDDYKFTISYYDASQAGAKTESGYEVTGEPFRVVTIEDPTRSEITSQVKVTNTLYEDGIASSSVEQMEWNDSNHSWDIVSLDENSNVVKRDGFTSGSMTPDSNNCYPEYNFIKDAKGNVVYKTKTVIKIFPWARETVLEVVDPDGKALTTEYQYYDNELTDGMNYGKLKAVINYDGSWTRYVYDSQGRDWKIIRPFNNSLITDAEDICAVSETTYDTDNNITCYVEKILGVEVSRSYEQMISVRVEECAVYCCGRGIR